MNRSFAVRARWIASATGVVEAATLFVRDGRIVGDECGARAIDFGDAILIPGLVNSHVHLDLDPMRQHRPPAQDFAAWLRAVVDFRRGHPIDQSDLQSAANETRATGTTMVADIATTDLSRVAWLTAGMRGIVFREVLGLGEPRWRPLLDAAIAAFETTGAVRSSISPHAPYSTALDAFRAASAAATEVDLPLCTHWRETAEEAQMLASGGGKLAEFLRGVVPAGAALPTLSVGVDDFVHYFGADGPRSLLVHANGMTPNDLDILARHRDRIAAVVHCPRTHAAFGRPTFDHAAFLSRGIRVTLGTDSLASNPDYDMRAEVREFRRTRPSIDARTALRMISDDAAATLNPRHPTGLAPGANADFAVLIPPAPMTAFDWEAVWDKRCRVAATCVGGAWRTHGDVPNGNELP